MEGGWVEGVVNLGINKDVIFVSLNTWTKLLKTWQVNLYIICKGFTFHLENSIKLI